MSYKPSRSDAIMFDKFTEKATNAKNEINQIIESGNYCKFDYLNILSKNIYLYWLNDNKANKAMYSRSEIPLQNYCSTYFISMFKRNIDRIYKPLRPIIQQIL